MSEFHLQKKSGKDENVGFCVSSTPVILQLRTQFFITMLLAYLAAKKSLEVWPLVKHCSLFKRSF